MKIDQPGRVGSTGATRAGGKASGAKPGEFQKFLDQTGGPGGVSSSQALGSVDALLAAQSVDTVDDQGRKQAFKRGEDLLDKLEEIRQALLGGSLSAGQVQVMAALIRSKRAACSDPRLREILDEIELRAEVELAKLTSASS
jgi:hypothetical protein